MTGRLQGKVAVVTGGCSGIGLACVERFLEEGARVVIGDIDDERGHTLVEQLGGPQLVAYQHVDVTSPEQVKALFEAARDTFGSVDVALNNAGIPTIDIIDFDYPYWHKADDLPRNCSAASLEEVGRVVSAWLTLPKRRVRF